MKKYLVLISAVAMVIAMVSGAWAGTGNVNVSASATVTNACQISGSGVLAFGSLDAVTDSTGATANDSGTISVQCTNGASVAITDDLGANETGAQMRMACTGGGCTPGTDYINYAISYSTPLAGQGIGTEIASGLNLSASIAANALDNVVAGSYGDTIVLTLTY